MPQTLIAPSESPFPKLPEYISYEDFLKLDCEYHHAEWVDGKVEWLHVGIDPLTGEEEIMVSTLHARITMLLINILTFFAEYYKLGEIFAEPFNMKTGSNLPGRSPDVFFLSRANSHRIKRMNLGGPADLVIEVVSEGSVTKDKVTKLREYEIGGVREYWIIDPLQNECLFYQLNSEGRFDLISADENGIYRSQVLKGLWIDVNWFQQDPLPTSIEVLKLWGLIPSTEVQSPSKE